MGFLIELSFNINKVSNFIKTKQMILKIAEKYNKTFSYNNHEIMGKNRTIFRNHYVMTYLFEDNENDIAKFVKQIKLMKHINIESISYDNCVFKMMYASKKYLNIMEKGKAKEYLEKKRNNELFKYDSVIMKEMYNK
tara:strand:+ start:430 stop:840 length:411 start_codon:yes stop_codon:yes gene_type:complete